MFSFYKNRYKFFAFSIVLIVIGILFSIFGGVNLDIQFKGGSLVHYTYEGELDLEKVDNLILDKLGKTVTCQINKNIADDSTQLVVGLAGNEALSPEELGALTKTLTEGYPDLKIKLDMSQLVNPSIGREMLTNGILAILVASLLIIAYVWFSFRSMSGPSAGVMALIALFHDILIAFFAFVVIGSPINETLIAVVLTILGFSINDTIVIYDRIRENMALTKGSMPLADLVDMSINQSLTRSIYTSLCTFVAIATAYVFALIYNLDSITQFALPMMIGIISGTYSTIVIAGPLWVMWKNRGKKAA